MFFRGVDSGKGDRVKLAELSYLFPEIIDAKFPAWDLTKTEYFLKIHANGSYFKEIEHLKYKYLLSLDGHTCAWLRVPWIMLSSSILVKTETNKLEWFYHKIKPYVHYVPIQ